MHAWAICRRDLRQFFTTPMAWLLIAAWSFVTNILFYFDVSAILQMGGSSSQPLQFHALSSGAIAMIFIIPAVTMHSFASERQQGTLRLLMSLPISNFQLMLGKLGASIVLLSVIAATSLGQLVALVMLSDVVLGAVLSAYLGLWLLIVLGCCLGVWVSTLVDSMVAAFVLTMSALTMLFLFALVSQPDSAAWPPLVWLGSLLGLTDRLFRLLAGDLRWSDVSWFITMAGCCVVLNHAALRARRQHG